MKYLDDISIPVSYNIYYKIDLNSDIYVGSNNIKLCIIRKTNIIQFNAKELNINSVLLNGQDHTIDNITHNIEDDIYTIQLNNTIIEGEYELLINFNGRLTNNDGLVKSYHKYTNRTYIYTRCEPIGARKIYPCWDEPKYKVKYNLSIEINDDKFNILANTDPSQIVKLSESTILYKFSETIPMSSYLQSFIISKFHYIEAYSMHNIRLRVYIPSDIKNNYCGKFSLDAGIKMLDFMIDYYGLSFPYNKIDFVPIDEPAAAGMENYGLIFYNIDFILNLEYTTISDKIATALVIAHELVHQWFGNILTINQWNNLWLKESFANFFQYLIVDKIFPEWNIKSYNVKKIIDTLYYDSYSNKSIYVKSINKLCIDDIYSKLTYDKGGLLLNILKKYLGEDQFRTNIRNYISKYKFTVIQTDLFVETIIDNLTIDEKNIMRKFIYQFLMTDGYPIIKSNDCIHFNVLNFINCGIHNNSIVRSDINWLILIKTTNYQITNSNINNLHQIINNKYFCYYRICYNKDQFKYILDNITNQTSDEHLSIFDDLYILGIFMICPFTYWILYTNKLLNLLITNTTTYNYYLISNIYNRIKFIKKNSSINKIFYQLIIVQLKKLIDKLINQFDIFNTNLYTDKLNNNLMSDDIHTNQLIFFLLNIKSAQSTLFIENLFDGKRFNLYGDLNNIIIKRIIILNDKVRISMFNQIIKEFPHMYTIINDQIIHTIDKKTIQLIFYKETTNMYNMNLSYIDDLLTNNKLFIIIFTRYFIENYIQIKQIFSNNMKRFHRFLNILIVNQTDHKTITQLFDKVNDINDNSIKNAKYQLYNKLYQIINIKRLINKYNHNNDYYI